MLNTPRKEEAGSVLWWLAPPGLIAGFLVPIFLIIVYLGQIDSPALTIRGYRYLDLYYSVMGLGYLALMAVAASIGLQIDLKNHGTVAERNWQRPAWVLGLIGLMAYVYWFRDFAINPSLWLQLLSGPGAVSRDEIGASTGITSLVNVLPVYFALVSHVWVSEPTRVPRGIRYLTCALVFLTLFRVYVWSERLALVELVVAVSVPAAMVLYQRSRSAGVKLTLRVLPLLALPMLIVYFAAAEYFRSWQSDTYQLSNLSFWEFALGRLATYYYTSLNNGVGMLETQAWPTLRFENVLLFLYKAPVLVGPIFSYYMDTDLDNFGRFLKHYGDPEFNNPSGIYAIVYDLGIAGAAVYMAALGFLAGVLCRALWKGHLRGVILYPSFMVMLLEIYRYPYLGNSRAFTVMLAVLLALSLIWLSPARQRPTP
jgi:oligosaccharide repeat unit polymerase